ncbi:hypothetical protein HAX54_045097, partial [Datura stramonium]|nr:hypothetical protein [Datura stramonium]
NAFDRQIADPDVQTVVPRYMTVECWEHEFSTSGLPIQNRVPPIPHRLPEHWGPKQRSINRMPSPLANRRLSNSEMGMIQAKKGKGPAKHRWNDGPTSSWLQATTWNLHYIGGSQIRTGNSPPCCRWSCCWPNLLLHTCEPAAIRRYH